MWGGRRGLYWPGPPQLPVHRSQWKFIFPIGHISFRIGLDSMLKLIRNYINPIRLTVNAIIVQKSNLLHFVSIAKLDYILFVTN
jgi:hypothetical protein